MSYQNSVGRRRALFREYYQSPLFLSMLSMPKHAGRHHFRFEVRAEDNSRSFVRIRKTVSTINDVKKLATYYAPSGIFFTPVEWLDPVHMRLSREKVRDCMLTSPLFFDIDVKPTSFDMLKAKEVTGKLTEFMKYTYGKDPDEIVFSGSSGFHVYYWNWDDIPMSHEHPRDRILAFIKSRKQLLRYLRANEIAVDPSVTADPWRVLRLPGTLHWTTGLIACKVRSLADFLPRLHAMAFPSEIYGEMLPYWHSRPNP